MVTTRMIASAVGLPLALCSPLTFRLPHQVHQGLGGCLSKGLVIDIGRQFDDGNVVV